MWISWHSNILNSMTVRGRPKSGCADVERNSGGTCAIQMKPASISMSHAGPALGATFAAPSTVRRRSEGQAWNEEPYTAELGKDGIEVRRRRRTCDYNLSRGWSAMALGTSHPMSMHSCANSENLASPTLPVRLSSSNICAWPSRR